MDVQIKLAKNYSVQTSISVLIQFYKGPAPALYMGCALLPINVLLFKIRNLEKIIFTSKLYVVLT